MNRLFFLFSLFSPSEGQWFFINRMFLFRIQTVAVTTLDRGFTDWNEPII